MRLFHVSDNSTRRVICGLLTTPTYAAKFVYYVFVEDVGKLRGEWDGPFIHRWHEGDAMCVDCLDRRSWKSGPPEARSETARKGNATRRAKAVAKKDAA